MTSDPHKDIFGKQKKGIQYKYQEFLETKTVCKMEGWNILSISVILNIFAGTLQCR